MEISVALMFGGFTIFFIWVNVSELHAKMDILMQSHEVDWKRYFTEELILSLQKGKLAKAAMILRQQTGLSFNTCQKIVSEYQSEYS